MPFVGFGGLAGVSAGAEVAEEVFCAGRGREVAVNEGVGGGAEIESFAGDDTFGFGVVGSFDRTETE